MKRTILVFVLMYTCLIQLFAVNKELRSVLPNLSESQYEQLENGEMVYGGTIDGASINQFFVSGTEAKKRALFAESIDNGFAIGAVSYIPYGPKLKALDHASRQLVLFNKIRAISTQEGLTYISWRAGNKEKVLIERSSYMEDSKNLNRLIPDPVVEIFPYKTESYVYQRDSSFGGNRYIHTYTNSDDEIFVEIKNISTMRVLGIFTAMRPEQLTIQMGTYQLTDGVLLVALTTVENRSPEVSIFGLTVDLPSAFRRRIVALQNWFSNQLMSLELE